MAMWRIVNKAAAHILPFKCWYTIWHTMAIGTLLKNQVVFGPAMLGKGKRGALSLNSDSIHPS
jgi:hypothetical protein